MAVFTSDPRWTVSIPAYDYTVRRYAESARGAAEVTMEHYQGDNLNWSDDTMNVFVTNERTQETEEFTVTLEVVKQYTARKQKG
jgi:hypothetical protein